MAVTHPREEAVQNGITIATPRDVLFRKEARLIGGGGCLSTRFLGMPLRFPD